MIKNLCCPGSSDDELKLFLYICDQTKLNPLTKQIYSISYWNNNVGDFVRAVVTGINGYRLIAERTGKYKGQGNPIWYDADGKAYKVWTKAQNPYACEVPVFKDGLDTPISQPIYWDAYCKRDRDGHLIGHWATNGAHMLAKCAEAQSLRKAFPQELSPISIPEEFDGDLDRKRKPDGGIMGRLPQLDEARNAAKGDESMCVENFPGYIPYPEGSDVVGPNYVCRAGKFSYNYHSHDENFGKRHVPLCEIDLAEIEDYVHTLEVRMANGKKTGKHVDAKWKALYYDLNEYVQNYATLYRVEPIDSDDVPSGHTPPIQKEDAPLKYPFCSMRECLNRMASNA